MSMVKGSCDYESGRKIRGGMYTEAALVGGGVQLQCVNSTYSLKQIFCGGLKVRMKFKLKQL